MQRDVNIRITPEQASKEELIRKALHISDKERFIILRKSVDARRRDVFIDLACRINPEASETEGIKIRNSNDSKEQAVVVGSGPAGLFAAMTLLEHGIRPIVIERGKDVHSRRVDIAKISTMGEVNSQSNYSFGEGGAGTYSDGKLFTRSKKRGDNTKVLGTFVQYGASESILYEAHPHIGTDKLPKIIENMRNAIVENGGKVLFETQVIALEKNNGTCTGVVAKDLKTGEEQRFSGPVILAIGNAARDTFEMLKNSSVIMEAKSLAMGVRLEHPQHLIDQIQYHNPLGRGKYLPAAEYSFATQVNVKTGILGSSDSKIGVYSFCMCPGGFVVPAASDSEQVVVNGMSPSNRGSVWANSGMVVEFPTCVLGNNDNPLAMMELQKQLELRTYECAGKTQKAPAQRMTDFMAKRFSSDLPKSSYSPGLTSFNLHELLPSFASEALSEGFAVFARNANGFMTNEAVMIGTETRTSSPVRIVRYDDSLESISCADLFPCGEGAGYAGGIVSAAIDGMRCAEKIAAKFGKFLQILMI